MRGKQIIQVAMEASEGWRRLDTSYVWQLWQAFVSDPVCSACLKALDTRLLSAGIVYTNSDYSEVASTEFQTHINVHFSRFVKDALVQMNILGFCFFYIDQEIPRVIQIGTADIRYRVNTDTFSVEIGVFRNNADVPDENIFALIDTLPDANGQLLSPMVSYYRSRILQDSFIRNAMTADYLNALPPIYTIASTDRVFSERDIAQISEVDNMHASLTNDNMRARTSLRLTDHQLNENIVRSLNNQNTPQQQARRVDTTTGLKNFDADMQMQMQSVIPLPLDARVASAPRATARSDIVSIIVHIESLACVAFGVNIESIGLATRGGGHLGAETLQQVNAVTFNTCQRWYSIFQPVLINVYNLIWGSSTKKNANDLTVLFPSMIAPMVVEKLYTSNVLTHKAYTDYLHTNYRLPIRSFEKTDKRMELLDSQIAAAEAAAHASSARTKTGGKLG
jgi:hypothetical protein